MTLMQGKLLQFPLKIKALGIEQTTLIMEGNNLFWIY